ncbi:diaminopimelate epimerase [Crocinitomix algicola]|uniref:diaminopimelate epimerase n=1 Tax=Crocinitomix algicola TaxID=1740263 RepID=UPI000831C70E|nr:diaminopimelate epimerase [Crocinitomix algicola]
MIEFYKYQGTGNDFILIDNWNGSFVADKQQFVQKWCERRFGIGSDGLIFIEKSDKADFKMDFYNPDGSQSFCGNGSRCAVAFSHHLGHIKNKKTVFEAIDGIHEGELTESTVKIAMHQYDGIEFIGNDYFIQTGSPHYIHYKDKNQAIDIYEYGQTIRYSNRFKELGTNVNLVEILDKNHIAVETYERGVEAETFACGTGATACGLSYAYKNKLNAGKIRVDVKGGQLDIHFTAKSSPGEFENIWLEGPAKYVFKGVIDDNN